MTGAVSPPSTGVHAAMERPAKLVLPVRAGMGNDVARSTGGAE